MKNASMRGLIPRRGIMPNYAGLSPDRVGAKGWRICLGTKGGEDKPGTHSDRPVVSRFSPHIQQPQIYERAPFCGLAREAVFAKLLPRCEIRPGISTDDYSSSISFIAGVAGSQSKPGSR